MLHNDIFNFHREYFISIVVASHNLSGRVLVLHLRDCTVRVFTPGGSLGRDVTMVADWWCRVVAAVT